jgi:hypothetical protein
MYGIETKRLKEAVKRNIERFEGDDFMFQLTNQEFSNLRSQIATSSWGGSRYPPFAFTELGIAMLSSVLNSELAIATNRKIMRAFVALRHYAAGLEELNRKIEKLSARLDDNDAKTDKVFKMLTELSEQKKAFENRTRIGFNVNRDND